MEIKRLDESLIKDLVQLSRSKSFPYLINEDQAKLYCNGNKENESVYTYGVYEKGKLVSIMTGTIFRVFPHKDSPKGKVVQISGAYTDIRYRHKGYALSLIECIEKDAVKNGVDYLCCDSIANELYKKAGFKNAPENEKRMWKEIKEGYK